MKKLIIFLAIILLLCIAGGALYFTKKGDLVNSTIKYTSLSRESSGNTKLPETSVVATDLNIPWSITFLPDKTMLVTERTGNLIQVKNSEKTVIKKIPVKVYGEGGLLGMALDPNFKTNGLIYFYYTYSTNGNDTINRVSKFKFTNGALSDEKIILDHIPGSIFHDGGRIKFGPDGFLYVTTGDAEVDAHAQDKNSLSGKILRVTTDGKAAPGNPFGTPIYSYGHRNPEGLAWDSAERLWATEHGRSGATSGLDELNRIEPGKNYGWPTIQGDQTKADMITPIINSGPNITWAPAGAIYLNGSIIFGGLKGQTLYEYNIASKKLTEHLKGKFGRIREVVLGPDGAIYISTSNRDGRGQVGTGDDKIIKIDPNRLSGL